MDIRIYTMGISTMVCAVPVLYFFQPYQLYALYSTAYIHIKVTFSLSPPPRLLKKKILITVGCHTTYRPPLKLTSFSFHIIFES